MVSVAAANGHSNVIEPFKATVPANPAVLFVFRRSFREWLQSARLDTVARDAFVLAVHEAVANGIEHGSGSSVLVEGRVHDRDVTVEVTTQGSWVEERERHGPLAERGRGLTLMRGLVNRLEVLDGGDRVTLELRAAAPVTDNGDVG